MLELYHAPNTRSVRVRWLLEELELPYQLRRVAFRPPARSFFGQDTPTGKLPTLVDGDVVICESGAIVEYLIERHGDGRLAPEPGSPERGAYLQWLHFAEATAFPPLGIVVWLSRYREKEGDDPALLADARERAASGLEYLEKELGEKAWLLGDAFSAADVMMGFTLVAARTLGVLDARFPRLLAYVERLQTRPALKRAVEDPA